MARKSDETKKYTTLYWIFLSLSVMVTILPILIYCGIGFAAGEVHAKLVLGIALTAALLLTVVNIILKWHMRSIVWIAVLGIYYCLGNIMVLLIIVAVGTILDEFLFTPLYKHYHAKVKINKEIDKRIP